MLAVIILTHNEEVHIARAIASVSEISNEIFVVDSGSTDATVEIAKRFGAEVLFNPWTNHADQFQWALDNAQFKSEWVLRLDADEIIEPDLAETISRRLPTLPENVTGVNLKRKHIFMGKWVRHGGRYPLVMLRLFRRGCARMEQRWMDEHILLLHGNAVTFEGGFADININDLTFFTAKHNKYATLEAAEVISAKLKPKSDHTSTMKLGSTRANVTRVIKDRIYNRIPFQLSALGYFIYRFIIQLGFLDGREGAIYHVLQGFWYRYLVGAKILELETAIAGLDKEAALVELTRLTGLRLND